jgi:UDPglucose 6-dehydrogenase
MSKLNIGVVGYGFVGKAVAHGFQNNNLFIVDPKLDRGVDISVMKNMKLDVVFIAVPTPMSASGAIDSSIVESTMAALKDMDTLLVLKSTVVPDIVQRLADEYPNFIYNPEFLTERNANWDFENPISNVYGGDIIMTKKLESIYTNYSICKPAATFHMTAPEASFVKYGMNTFLSAKVLFWNQFQAICAKNGANYSEVVAAIGNDPRIGPSHTTVPGPDGRYGFGGACFTKDTAAFIRYANNEFTVLNEVVRTNNIIRSQYELDSREKDQNVSYSL